MILDKCPLSKSNNLFFYRGQALPKLTERPKKAFRPLIIVLSQNQFLILLYTDIGIFLYSKQRLQTSSDFFLNSN